MKPSPPANAQRQKEAMTQRTGANGNDRATRFTLCALRHRDQDSAGARTFSRRPSRHTGQRTGIRPCRIRRGTWPHDRARGISVTLFAAEPDVVQPIAFTIDELGFGGVWVCASAAGHLGSLKSDPVSDWLYFNIKGIRE